MTIQNTTHENLNPSLPFYSEEGVEIRFLTVKNRIELAVIINETTGVESLKNSWSFIDEWRRRLIAFQGPSLQFDDFGGEYGPSTTHIMLWRVKQKDDLSWAQLAQAVNDHVAAMLDEHVKQLDVYLKRREEFLQQRIDHEENHSQYPAFLQWLYDTGGEYYAELATDLLVACGVTETDAGIFIEDAVQNIRNGRQAFLPKTPIDSEALRKKIARSREKVSPR